MQGVYVDPDRRGEGLSVAGMAAVVALVREQVAPTVSLYVNEWNAAARAAYARVGFTETARLSDADVLRSPPQLDHRSEPLATAAWG